MHKRLHVEKAIIGEARRIAAEHGTTPSQYQLREILTLVRGWMDDGRDWPAATEYAATLVLRRLHAIEDAPWK